MGFVMKIKSTLLLMTVHTQNYRMGLEQLNQHNAKLLSASKNIEAYPMTFTKTINMGA
jgi:hypothetical protein